MMGTLEKDPTSCGIERLEKKHCLPCEGSVAPLNKEEVNKLINQLEKEWQINADYKQISKDFHFKNFYQTMAFVNAIAWMAHYENHHPDLEIGYNHCLVHYTTHAINGLSENDFICAKKIDRIINPFEEKSNKI